MAFESILDFINESHLKEIKFHICGDSKLVIEQMNKTWQIKQGRYVPFAKRCQQKLKTLKEAGCVFVLQWIPREQNGYADELSKGCLVKNGIEFKIQPLEKEELQELKEKTSIKKVPFREINSAYINSNIF